MEADQVIAEPLSVDQPLFTVEQSAADRTAQMIAMSLGSGVIVIAQVVRLFEEQTPSNVVALALFGAVALLMAHFTWRAYLGTGISVFPKQVEIRTGWKTHLYHRTDLEEISLRGQTMRLSFADGHRRKHGIPVSAADLLAAQAPLRDWIAGTHFQDTVRVSGPKTALLVHRG